MKVSFDGGGISEQDVQSAGERLSEYHARLADIVVKGGYEELECSACLPADGVLQAESAVLVDEMRSDALRFIALIGIGGSNLGAKAIYEALRGYADAYRSDDAPRILSFETTDAASTHAMTEKLLAECGSPDEFLIVLVSKSGGTTETIAHAEALLSSLRPRFAGVEERLVTITDDGSTLWKAATEHGIRTIAIPQKVGGRYSVLSAVGLVPLGAAGFDVVAFSEGAREMRDKLLGDDPEQLLAKSVAFFDEWLKRGMSVYDLFFFSPRLESLGKWTRQLIAESLGKDGKGITPTISIGSTDLHSMFQLYMAGPKMTMTMFVSVEAGGSEASVPEERMFPGIQPHIAGKTFGDINSAIRRGAMSAYAKRGNPFIDVSFSDFSEREIGAYMQWQMIVVMCMGHLLSVDAFDQHDVQSYKDETARILRGE